jgi:hypothetical protein
MASTVDLYIGPIKIGSGSAAAASASISSFTDNAAFHSVLSNAWKASVPGHTSGEAFTRHPHVTILVTQAGTHVGRSWYTKILSDNGAGTLTVRDACPFVGA